METSLLIFLGCGLGGLARYWTSNLAHAFFGLRFPIGTLFVNVTGSLLMGFLFVFLFDRFAESSQAWRPFLLIGLLGGYTTMSSFSIETINLLEAGNYWVALFNIILSILLCIAAAWFGVLLGRDL